jgi:hypothetical protein
MEEWIILAPGFELSTMLTVSNYCGVLIKTGETYAACNSADIVTQVS